MLFYIRFRKQLRRTRPELIASLEAAVTEAVSAAGGSVEAGRRVLAAAFNEDRICFWLDMVIFLESIHKVMRRAAGELHGYVLALGKDIPEVSVDSLCRSLFKKNDRQGTGIWCSEDARKALELYMTFGPQSIEGYGELQEWRTFNGESGHKQNGSFRRDKIKQALESNSNTLFSGPDLQNMGTEIYHCCTDFLGDIPPLIVRFGTGGRGLVCFVDAFTPRIRSFISGAVSPAAMDELDAAHGMLFRERLREKWSPYMMEQGQVFINSLLTAYVAAVKTSLPRGVLILDTLNLAEDTVTGIFNKIYFSMKEREGLLVLASDCCTGESLEGWENVFPRTLSYTPDDFPLPDDINANNSIPRDVWEISYNIFLLGRYFPAYLFPQIFEEEKLNQQTYLRAIKILASLGIFAGEDARLPDFALRAEEHLGERKEKIRRAVREIVLSWVLSGRLRPCFNLLKILSQLGQRAGDSLVLRAIRADVLNGTWEGIEQSIREGTFACLVGDENTHVLSYIYNTSKALVWGDASGIQQVFQQPSPPLVFEDGSFCYEGSRAQAEANLAAFYICSHNSEAASEAIRKVIHINRDLRENAVPAYRIFSLVNLFRQRIADALEYISFAVEHAEKMEQNEELVLACYFASSVNFLHGNLSKAERLAARAEEAALALGQSGWAARAKFFRGRLRFETGRYVDALGIFESLHHNIGETGANTVRINTVRDWIYRTNVFLGRFPQPENSSGLDGKIFEIEAAYFATDYERARDLAEEYLSTAGEGVKNNFLFTEQPDWRSGFAQCEYMLFAGKNAETRMAWIYRAMAQ